MKTLVFTIGSDPEMLVKKNGNISSAAGILGCSKDKKLHLSERVRLQEDNVLAEFDIDPCIGWDQFNTTMKEGLDLVKAELAKHGLEIAEGVTSHIFSKAELDSFHKSAFEFGCTPDYNALTLMKNPSPSATEVGLRTAGGHIHIGFPKEVAVNRDTQSKAGLLCDYYHSLPAMFTDTDDRRKELYGKAGAIRLKDYGIEYRSLSAFWISKEDLRKMVYEQTEKVVKELVTDKLMELHSILPLDRLHNIINTNDRRTADTYLARLGII